MNSVHCTGERKGVGESQILNEEPDKGVKEPLAGYTEIDTLQKCYPNANLWQFSSCFGYFTVQVGAGES